MKLLRFTLVEKTYSTLRDSVTTIASSSCGSGVAFFFGAMAGEVPETRNLASFCPTLFSGELELHCKVQATSLRVAALLCKPKLTLF